MSSDVERLLIRCGLPQYSGKLLAANMTTYQSMQAKRELLPVLIPVKEHCQILTDALGVKGTAAVSEGVELDPIEAALDDWEKQLRSRLRRLAASQAQLMVTRVGTRSGSSSASNGPQRTGVASRQDVHDIVSKMEHSKGLLAAVNSGKRAHRKYVELSRILQKYRNRAGDPKEVDLVKQQLADHEGYIKRILVTLQEEEKLHQTTGEDGDADVELVKPPTGSRIGSSRGRGVAAAAPLKHDDPNAAEDAGRGGGGGGASSTAMETMRRSVIGQVWDAALEVYNMERVNALVATEQEKRRQIEREENEQVIDLLVSRTMVIRW